MSFIGICLVKVTIGGDEAKGDFVKAIGGSGAGITGYSTTIKSGRVEANGNNGGAGIGGRKGMSQNGRAECKQSSGGLQAATVAA